MNRKPPSKPSSEHDKLPRQPAKARKSPPPRTTEPTQPAKTTSASNADGTTDKPQ